MTGMDVELLVVPDCANQRAAAALIRTALDDIGLPGATVRTTVIATQWEADQRGFTGSPTILLNGRDPFAPPGRPPALACRIYRGPGGPSPLPALPDLRRALRRAADRSVKRQC